MLDPRGAVRRVRVTPNDMQYISVGLLFLHVVHFRLKLHDVEQDAFSAGNAYLSMERHAKPAEHERRQHQLKMHVVL